MPVEVKSRVSINTIDEAVECLRTCVGLDDWEEDKPYMFSMAATDSRFAKLIGSKLDPNRKKRELFQLLHHAYVYNVNKVLLIVGSNRNFLFAVEVEFNDDLLSAYDMLIELFYKKWFHIFFVNNLADLPIEQIESALKIRNATKAAKDVVDRHSFITNYKLWRSLNVKIPSGISFPLPPMAMVIPFINAFWNSTKGPSDTMTRLLDSCEENLGIRTPQSVAVARLFNLMAVAFHRSVQVATSKDDYNSIESFRNAASHRYTFQKSMATIVHLLHEELLSF